jgi:hypothetical protein
MAHPKPESAFIVELIPAGLANSFFKLISEQQGLYWIGVRGRLRRQYLPEIYDFSKRPYGARVNDTFEVCLDSLELALSLAKRRAVPKPEWTIQ